MELKEAIEFVKAELDYNETSKAMQAVEVLVAHARRSLDVPKAEADPDAEVDNLWRATRVVRELERVRGVVAELKSAFARNELDGGVKAAYTHPLYVQAQARIAELHQQLLTVI